MHVYLHCNMACILLPMLPVSYPFVENTCVLAFDLSFSVILHPSNFACKQRLNADSGLCHVIRYGNVVAYSAAVMNLTGPDPQHLFHTMGVPSTPSLTLDAQVFDLAGTQVTAGMILFAPLCPTLSHCIVSNCASCT